MKIVTNPDGSQSLEMSDEEARLVFKQLRCRFANGHKKKGRHK